jgi:glycerol uptake facilitator-like aquaporin
MGTTSMATSPAPDFDPRIIEAFAENLYKKAASFLVGSVVFGVVMGMSFGAVPLTSLGENWPIPSMLGFATMMLGGVLGGVIGYVVGDTRAFGYKLQAQGALCQLEVERNSAEAAYWLQQLVEGAGIDTQDAPAERPAPQPAQPAPRPAPPLPPAATRAAPAASAPPTSAPPLSPPVSAAR